MRACRASLHMSGARPWPTGRPHKAPRASVAKRAARNISAHRGQGCDTADTTGQPACSSSTERSPPAGTEEPAPRGDLGVRAQRADASSYMPYFAAAWRRATLALMHGTMPTASAVAASLAHQGRALSYAVPLPKTANNRPVPQTTGFPGPQGGGWVQPSSPRAQRIPPAALAHQADPPAQKLFPLAG